MGKGEQGSAASAREGKDRALTQIQSALGRRVSSWHAIPDQYSLRNQDSQATYIHSSRISYTSCFSRPHLTVFRPHATRIVKSAAQPEVEMVDLIYVFILENGQPNICPWFYTCESSINVSEFLCSDVSDRYSRSSHSPNRRRDQGQCTPTREKTEVIIE